MKAAEKETSIRENCPANQEAAAEEPEKERHRNRVPGRRISCQRHREFRLDPKEAEAKSRAVRLSERYVSRTMDMKVEIRAEFAGRYPFCWILRERIWDVLIGKRGQTLDSLQYLTSPGGKQGKGFLCTGKA